MTDHLRMLKDNDNDDEQKYREGQEYIDIERYSKETEDTKAMIHEKMLTTDVVKRKESLRVLTDSHNNDEYELEQILLECSNIFEEESITFVEPTAQQQQQQQDMHHTSTESLLSNIDKQIAIATNQSTPLNVEEATSPPSSSLLLLPTDELFDDNPYYLDNWDAAGRDRVEISPHTVQNRSSASKGEELNDYADSSNEIFTIDDNGTQSDDFKDEYTMDLDYYCADQQEAYTKSKHDRNTIAIGEDNNFELSPSRATTDTIDNTNTDIQSLQCHLPIEHSDDNSPVVDKEQQRVLMGGTCSFPDDDTSIITFNEEERKREPGDFEKNTAVPTCTANKNKFIRDSNDDVVEIPKLISTEHKIVTGRSIVAKLPSTITSRRRSYAKLIETCLDDEIGCGGNIWRGGLGVTVYLRMKLSTIETNVEKSREYLHAALELARTAATRTASRNTQFADDIDAARTPYISLLSNNFIGSHCLLVSILVRLGKKPEAIEISECIIDEILQLYNKMDDKNDCSVIFGLAGALQALWFLRRELDEEDFATDLALIITSSILVEGLQHEEYNSKLLLMWEWNVWPYLGSGLGAVGILLTLLVGHTDQEWEVLEESFPTVKDVIRETIDSLSGYKYESGNLKASINGCEEDQSIDWMHGASGYCLLLLQAFEVYGDETYFYQASDIVENIIWPRRMKRRKGLGLARGVAGMAYVFLTVARIDSRNRKQWISRANKMVEEAITEREELQDMATYPNSLCDGLGGLVSLLIDLEEGNVDQWYFPFFEYSQGTIKRPLRYTLPKRPSEELLQTSIIESKHCQVVSSVPLSGNQPFCVHKSNPHAAASTDTNTTPTASMTTHITDVRKTQVLDQMDLVEVNQLADLSSRNKPREDDTDLCHSHSTFASTNTESPIGPDSFVLQLKGPERIQTITTHEIKVHHSMSKEETKRPTSKTSLHHHYSCRLPKIKTQQNHRIYNNNIKVASLEIDRVTESWKAKVQAREKLTPHSRKNRKLRLQQ